jgi:carboxymethylenebutenolidase
MRAAVKNAGKNAEIIVYQKAPHGFYADYRPSYTKADADDSWKRLLDWFKKHGV